MEHLIVHTFFKIFKWDICIGYIRIKPPVILSSLKRQANAKKVLSKPMDALGINKVKPNSFKFSLASCQNMLIFFNCILF